MEDIEEKNTYAKGLAARELYVLYKMKARSSINRADVALVLGTNYGETSLIFNKLVSSAENSATNWGKVSKKGNSRFLTYHFEPEEWLQMEAILVKFSTFREEVMKNRLGGLKNGEDNMLYKENSGGL